MQAFQTIGKTIYPGFALNLIVRENLEYRDLGSTSLMQLMYIHEGLVIVQRQDGDKKLNAPMVLCINHRRPSAPLHLEDSTGFSLIFQADVVNHSLGSESGSADDKSFKQNELILSPFRLSTADYPVYLPIDAGVQERILSIKDDLIKQLSMQPDEYWPCRGRSFFLEIMAIVQSFLGQNQEDSDAVLLPSGDELVSSAARIACIRYHDTSLGLSRLARELAVSPLELDHRFVASSGESFSQFLGRLRASVAANLIRNTILDLGSIQKRCGYRTMLGMELAFLHRFKLRPGTYRKIHPNPYG